MKITRRTRRAARRLYRASRVDGLLDDGRVRHVVGRVAAARRRGGLALLSHFLRLVRLDRASHQALVESALPLSPELRASVAAGVRRAYGPGLETSFADEPALIAGMRVKVGSDVYDGSVRTTLLELEKRF
jgi:F-type H+-transporting ATPase subunit delta